MKTFYDVRFKMKTYNLKMMTHLNIWIAISFLVIFCHHTSSLRDAQKCRFDRVRKMFAYNCASLRLNAIPKYLKTSTEVLDASENRIRKLNRESFSQYTNLKFLYLSENIISKVEPGTFALLIYLETLDLSSNVLRVVPPEILNLPRLRKLYLADNELTNVSFALVKKPIRSPLEYLNLASNEFYRIPDIGILPELNHLNFSMNILEELTPEQFAPFCQIKFVDLNDTKVNACQCAQVNYFMEEELQRLPILECGKTPADCKLERNYSSPIAKDYQRCLVVKEELKEIQVQARLWFGQFSWPQIIFFSFIALWVSVMILLSCKSRPVKKDPPDVSTTSDFFDMKINPNSRNTLIM